MSIPAKKLVSVIPGVIAAGGSALALTGLMLSADTAVPIGTARQFSDSTSVSNFFGPASVEAALAAIYFSGFDNSSQKPGALLFAQYPTAPVAAYLRSANLASLTLAQLQAIPAGTMSITVNGTAKTSSSINLATSTSFSDAASKITAGFTGSPTVTVTYDAQRAAFVATSGTTGTGSTISFASGAMATALSLTQALGAETSQGAVAATPAGFMNSVSAVAANWAGFMTVFEPNLADKIAFATWNAQQGNRSVYSAWDTDATAGQQGNTTSFGPQLAAQTLGGTVAVSADPARAAALGVTMTDLTRPLAAFVLGYMASIDFTEINGRTTAAYRSGAGIVAGVGDANVADNLMANGYNFYGDYATSSQSYRFLQPGQVSGIFEWLDSYINQIWMNANFQQTLLSLMANLKSIPYNNFGYSAIETALSDPINQAIDFGAIRVGVSLTGTQAIAVNASAGVKIDSVLSTRGWYLKVGDPGGAARAARSTPDMEFYYTDGGSIQSMSLSSLLIQ